MEYTLKLFSEQGRLLHTWIVDSSWPEHSTVAIIEEALVDGLPESMDVSQE
jgi:hypothetical protein